MKKQKPKNPKSKISKTAIPGSHFGVEKRSCLLFDGSSYIHGPQGTWRPRTHDAGGFPLVNWQLALCFRKINDLLWSESSAVCFSWQVTYTSFQLRLWIVVESSDNLWRSGLSFVDPYHHRRLNCSDATWPKTFEPPHEMPHRFHSVLETESSPALAESGVVPQSFHPCGFLKHSETTLFQIYFWMYIFIYWYIDTLLLFIFGVMLVICLRRGKLSIKMMPGVCAEPYVKLHEFLVIIIRLQVQIPSKTYFPCLLALILLEYPAKPSAFLNH